MKFRWKGGIERIGRAIKVETAYVAKKVGRGCSHATERRNGALLQLTGGDEMVSRPPPCRVLLGGGGSREMVANRRDWLGATRERHTSETAFSELEL